MDRNGQSNSPPSGPSDKVKEVREAERSQSRSPKLRVITPTEGSVPSSDQTLASELGRLAVSPRDQEVADKGRLAVPSQELSPQQAFEKANTSLQTFFQGLSDTLKPYTSFQRELADVVEVTDVRFPTLERLLEMREQIRSLPEDLDSLAKAYNISKGDFRTFADAEIQSMKGVIGAMNRIGASKEVESMEQSIQLHEHNYGEKSLVSDLTTLEGDIKKLSDQIYDLVKEKVAFTIMHKEYLFKWIDSKPQESLLSNIRKSSEYVAFKTTFLKLKKVFKQMESFEDNKSTSNESAQEIANHKDQLLKDLATTHGEFSTKHQVFREQLQNPEIRAEWIQEGKEVFERVKAKSIERQKKGMTGPVIEQSWKSFYKCCIKKLKPDIWRPPTFDWLMRDGLLKGNEDDYYFVWMQPKLPDDTQPFEELYDPLMAYVNPREGVLLNAQEHREIEQKWRDTFFPKEFSQEWLEGIKQNLGIEDLPGDFFKPLYVSDLSVLAYQLGVEKYKEESSQSDDQDNKLYWSPERDPSARPLLSKNDLSPAPLTEIVGMNIVYPEAVEKLLKHGETGKMTIFSRGEEGFDLVLATHYGRRVLFMQSDYPEIVGNGEITRVGIYRELASGSLYIQIFLDPKNRDSHTKMVKHKIPLLRYATRFLGI